MRVVGLLRFVDMIRYTFYKLSLLARARLFALFMASSPTEDVRRSFKRLTVDHSRLVTTSR